ncbi:uncharacterized protein LOC144909422 [Branchiostoma floridae x Branchiostoma belcheri]
MGMEYLYGQTDHTFSITEEEELESQIDEGFLEEDLTVTLEPLSTDDPALIMSTIPGDSSDRSDNDESASVDKEISLDSVGIPGWDKVDRLAQALLQLKGQATTIKKLYDELSDYDKRPITYQPRNVDKPAKG